MSVEQRHHAIKAQGLLREYGPFLDSIMQECMRELEAPINGETVEAIGLEYARRLAGKSALKLFLTKINAKANER